MTPITHEQWLIACVPVTVRYYIGEGREYET